MSLLARLHAEHPFLFLADGGWRRAAVRLRNAWAGRWARLPAPQRILEMTAIAIVVIAAALFVWVLWTQPMNRR